MKIAINKCYGGFSLSALAEKLIAERKGESITFWDNFTDKEVSFEEAMSCGCLRANSNLKELDRNDPDLIAVIEEIGEMANTSVSDIQIIEIPDGVEWVIEEYDGVEWVSEKHRIWR